MANAGILRLMLANGPLQPARGLERGRTAAHAPRSHVLLDGERAERGGG
jgi:hypothetical protein